MEQFHFRRIDGRGPSALGSMEEGWVFKLSLILYELNNEMRHSVITGKAGNWVPVLLGVIGPCDDITMSHKLNLDDCKSIWVEFL